jgi:hypothetical protein
MARPKPEKKPAAAESVRVLPMELRIGDRFADETGGEWEVISRPYSSAGGKLVSAHVRRAGTARDHRFADLECARANQREANVHRGGQIAWTA